jgi:hypothetical protein
MKPLLSRMLAAVALPLLLAACEKPKVGGKCEAGQALCEDGATLLVCQGGTFLEAKCRGPSGCAKEGTRVTCDESVATAGDLCLETAGQSHACTADKKTSLACDKGKFKAVQTCRGPGGCQVRGEQVTCDAKTAEKGDLCTSSGTFACSGDLKSRLLCKDGAFSFDRYCRGATGCHAGDQACDETVSDVGDPCGVPGMAACNSEGSAELSCQGGQFIKDHPCKQACRVTSTGKVECL